MARKHSEDEPVRTETEEPGQFYEGSPVPVHIQSSYAQEFIQDAAEVASYATYTPLTTDAAPTRIAPRNPRRHRLIVFVSGASATTYMNKAIEPLQATVPSGFRIASPPSPGVFLILENQEPLYIIATVGTPTVAVIDESWIKVQGGD